MAKFSVDFLTQTIQVWQPYSPEPLTLAEAEEIARNMTDLFSYLLELKEKREKRTSETQP